MSLTVQVEPHTGGLQSFAVRIKDGLAAGSTPGLAKPQNAELRSGASSEGTRRPWHIHKKTKSFSGVLASRCRTLGSSGAVTAADRVKRCQCCQ